MVVLGEHGLCSNVKELLKNTPDIVSDLPILKNLSLEINVNQVNVLKG